MNRLTTILIVGALTLGLVGCSDRSSPTPSGSVETAATAAPTPAPAPAAASAQAKDPIPSDAVPSDPPIISFDRTEHDFGTIPETESASTEIEFTNTGGSELVITDVKTTCGCTAATPNKRRYEPGESGSLTVEFTPAAPGPQKKFVNVFSNAANTELNGITKLMITAQVDAFLEVEPRYARLGPMGLGEEHHTTVAISCVDPDFVVESVGTSSRWMTANVLDGPEPGAKQIDVTISADAPWGPVFSWLEITVKGRPEPDAEPIRHLTRARVQGQLFGELHADPDTFRAGAKPGEDFERTIVLSRPSGVPFQILEATVETSGLSTASIRFEPQGSSAFALILTGTAGPRETPFNGTVQVTTDVPGEETLEIGISGSVRTEPGGVH